MLMVLDYNLYMMADILHTHLQKKIYLNFDHKFSFMNKKNQNKIDDDDNAFTVVGPSLSLTLNDFLMHFKFTLAFIFLNKQRALKLIILRM